MRIRSLPKSKNENWIDIFCPLRFSLVNKECLNIKCAWFLPIQRACFVQVFARGNAFPINNKR